jgi:hypothetical protein
VAPLMYSLIRPEAAWALLLPGRAADIWQNATRAVRAYARPRPSRVLKPEVKLAD